MLVEDDCWIDQHSDFRSWPALERPRCLRLAVQPRKADPRLCLGCVEAFESDADPAPDSAEARHAGTHTQAKLCRPSSTMPSLCLAEVAVRGGARGPQDVDRPGGPFGLRATSLKDKIIVLRGVLDHDPQDGRVWLMP